MYNFTLEPSLKLCSFHNFFVNRNVCQNSMRFEEASCAWNNWFTVVQIRRFGRNCCRWTGFIWSFLVTQVVTYIRTTPTPLVLLFIPFKFLVCMMIKFIITKEKEKEEDTIKRPQQNVLSTYEANFFIILFGRAFKMMKNGIFFSWLPSYARVWFMQIRDLWRHFVDTKWCKITKNLISLTTFSV